MITPFSADGTINQLPDGHPYLMASYTSPLHYATAMQKHLGASEPGASQAPPPPAVLEPEPEPGMAADPPTKELVADLCKIIENQTSEINTLRDSKPKVRAHPAANERPLAPQPVCALPKHLFRLPVPAASANRRRPPVHMLAVSSARRRSRTLPRMTRATPPISSRTSP
jgi:hypothetical protein